MATVVFVHGTGVRSASFYPTFALIQQAFEDFGIRHALVPCLWGDALGATPARLSLPDLIDPGLVGADRTPAALDAEQEYARWELLYRDPLFELRLLKHRPTGSGSGPAATRSGASPGTPAPPTGTASGPAGAASGAAAWRRIAAYAPSDDLRALLQSDDWRACFAEAWTAVIVEDQTAAHVMSTAREIGEPGQAIARALIAATCTFAFARDLPQPDARRRGALVDRLVDDWQVRVAGVGAWLARIAAGFAGFAGAFATPIVKARRGDLTCAAAFATGDVLRYQARGEAIRDYIRTTVARVGGDVYLLAHSLGGIACVDLLAEQRLDDVRGLITVGSQAPYLYELGALHGLPPGSAGLPDDFPRWLNLYDPYDFLSYVAARVFPGDVTDCCIRSGQPFPHAHSAYWTHDETWRAVRAFLR